MIVAGFGFTSRATTDSLAQALEATGHSDTAQMFATPSDKAVHPQMQHFAREKSIKVRAITQTALQATKTQTQSPISQNHRRTGSVAEAAALAAAGPGATLIVTRQKSQDRMATCAIAKGADT